MSITVDDDTLMERAIEFYDAHLKNKLEPVHNGEFVGIDPAAGLYSVGKDPVAIYYDLKAQGSTGLQAMLRVGYDWTYDMLGADA
jgi:hypothetical protein